MRLPKPTQVETSMACMRYGMTLNDKIAPLLWVASPLRTRSSLVISLRSPEGVFRCPDLASAYQLSAPWEVALRKVLAGCRGLFVDVGAHMGRYSVMQSKLGNEVIALEPNRRTFGFLQENMESSGCKGYSLVNKAAWSGEGWMRFRSHRVSGESSITKDGDDVVQTTTLDSVLDGRVPRMMKVDVEGSEPQAFCGMQSTLSEAEDMAIVFESLDAGHLQASMNVLRHFGFRTSRLDPMNYLATKGLP